MISDLLDVSHNIRHITLLLVLVIVCLSVSIAWQREEIGVVEPGQASQSGDSKTFSSDLTSIPKYTQLISLHLQQIG